MKIALFAGMGLVACACLAFARNAQEENPGSSGGGAPAVVVGTFDSRAVAIAYVRSDEFRRRLDEKREELERAQAAGDEARVAELEAFGPELQRHVHEQGFSTAPVDDIVVRIEDRLAGIAERRGVDVIVSKWVLAYSAPGARFVDVTEDLAACFDPDEATWKTIRQIVAQDPVPLDELQHDH